MPEDLNREPRFLAWVVGGPLGELTLIFLLLYCDTPGPFPLGSKDHTLD